MADAVTSHPPLTRHPRVDDFPLRARVMASIIGPVAWLSFTLLYVGFWAKGFTLFQSVIVILVSVTILGGLMGALWASLGFGYRNWTWDE
jgi:hypothetical protein